MCFDALLFLALKHAECRLKLASASLSLRLARLALLMFCSLTIGVRRTAIAPIAADGLRFHSAASTRTLQSTLNPVPRRHVLPNASFVGVASVDPDWALSF